MALPFFCAVSRFVHVQGLIVCELNQIPNQPIRFAGEESGRSEDSLIAKTWEIFVDTREAYALGMRHTRNV